MKKIVVIGSINVDNVTYTDNMPIAGMTVKGESFLSNLGGKGANQACAIHFLNKDVVFYGAVGNDTNGKMVENYLKSLGLTANLKICNDSCTGVATIIINNKNAENQIICVPGANNKITKNEIDKIDFSKFDILLLQLENPGEVMTYAMKKAKEAGLLVVLNPAPYQYLKEEAYQYVDYFIPNEHELELYTSEVEGDIKERSRYLLDKGLKNIIVTLGEKGSIFINKEEAFEIPAFKVNAVDTTGAGDSYCGALVSALSEGKNIKEAMEFATKASSIAVTRKGAIASLPKLDEII